jgi:Holliday junction resolvase RusA-like endonuclease
VGWVLGVFTPQFTLYFKSVSEEVSRHTTIKNKANPTMTNASIPYYCAEGDEAVETLGPDGKTVKLEFRISGTPRAQPRGRRSKNSNRPYNPAGKIVRNFRTQVRKQLLSQTTVFGPNVKVRIDCWFGFKRARSHYSNDGVLKSTAPHYPKIADVDNLSKLIMDGLVGIVYKDDIQITTLRAGKRYIARPSDGQTVIIARIDKTPRPFL